MACLLTHGRAEVCKEFVGGIKSIYFINYGDLGAIGYGTINTSTTFSSGSGAWHYTTTNNKTLLNEVDDDDDEFELGGSE